VLKKLLQSALAIAGRLFDLGTELGGASALKRLGTRCQIPMRRARRLTPAGGVLGLMTGTASQPHLGKSTLDVHSVWH